MGRAARRGLQFDLCALHFWQSVCHWTSVFCHISPSNAKPGFSQVAGKETVKGVVMVWREYGAGNSRQFTYAVCRLSWLKILEHLKTDLYIVAVKRTLIRFDSYKCTYTCWAARWRKTLWPGSFIKYPLCLPGKH